MVSGGSREMEKKNEALPHPEEEQEGRRRKLAANKKRPGLLRVVGRPNSPPPELLKNKLIPNLRHVNPTFVLQEWHEAAISGCGVMQPANEFVNWG